MASITAGTQAVVDHIEAARVRPGVFDVVGVGLLVLFLVMALVPQVFTPYDPVAQDVVNRLKPPTAEHLFGTDELGRDIFSRIIHGTRVSLTTAFVAVVVSLLLGVPVGLISGFVGGKLDEVLSRATDLLLSFPAIIVAMTIIAITGQNPLVVAMVIGVVAAPSFVRVTRAITLKERDLPYVDAIRSAGATGFYLMFRTILPNCMSAVYLQVLLVASRAIIIESSLSFLGLGVPPPAPTWGAMLSKSRNYFYQSPTYGIFPGLFIALLVVALQLTSGYLQKRAKMR